MMNSNKQQNINFYFNKQKFKNKFIYKFGIFRITITKPKNYSYHELESSHLIGMLNVVAVVAHLSYLYNNTYLLALMINTIDYICNNIASRASCSL